MKVRVEFTVTRTYEMDLDRIMAEFGEEIAADMARGRAEAQVMRETFHELCGFERDEDHVDGSYVRLTSETGEIEFYDAKGGAIWL